MSASIPHGLPGSTSDPKVFEITENEVLKVLGGGGPGGQPVPAVEGLSVRFRDGKMHLVAEHLAYSMIRVDNLEIIGRLMAQDGKLELETESISPRGLVTAMIPRFAKQALEKFTSQWYVEEVEALDGRLRIRIR